MSANTFRLWLPEEDDLVIVLWMRGTSVADIQRALVARTGHDRTRHAVYDRVYHLGLPRRRRWTGTTTQHHASTI